ncbi:MAG TPA: sulfite exporter TauE/SafE family protein [Hellea balneolensis]|uniref:Probable membrane transporter protein n=1 Tax=Hellea balneolensis TaxID=287478 RepID=A0A7C5LTT9_9PROT|nr:sulfite exporter TauE/SafE family protein [Hellea balneolensis]
MDLQLLILLCFWGILVGTTYASVGAAGGILASFGLISIAGITDPNSIKPAAQIIVLSTGFVFIPKYFKSSALVWPLGVLLGLGGLFGAWVGSTISTYYLSDMAAFKPWFGVLTYCVAILILVQIYRSRHQENQNSLPVSGVTDLTFHGLDFSFSYAGQTYHILAIIPVLAGFIIAALASIFGVGGGFLLVPFMVSILRLPMHIIPATTAIAIIISLVVSIGNYLRLGANIQYDVVLAILVGSLIGAFLGVSLNRRLKNTSLQAILALVVMMIGTKYLFFA